MALKSSAYDRDELAFGEFDGDGAMDIFTASGTGWAYHPGGSGTAVALATSATVVSQLAIGDFDGDGISDVFYGDGSSWRWSRSGSASWAELALSSATDAALPAGWVGSAPQHIGRTVPVEVTEDGRVFVGRVSYSPAKRGPVSSCPRLCSAMLLLLVATLSVTPTPVLAAKRAAAEPVPPPTPVPTERVVVGAPYSEPTLPPGAPSLDEPRRYYVHTGNTLVVLKLPALKLPVPGQSIQESWAVQRFALPALTPAGESRGGTLPTGASFEDFVELSGHAYVLFSLPTDTFVAVYAQEVDMATGQLVDTNAGRPLFTTASAGASPERDDPFAFWLGPRFKFVPSPGGKALLAVYRTKAASRDDSVNHEVYGVHVVAAATAKTPLREIWHREVPLPYSEQRMDIWGFAVDDAGIAYVSAKVREGDGKRDSVGRGDETGPAYHAEILRLSEGSAGFDVTPVLLAGKYIHSLSLAPVGGKLRGAGLYRVPGAQGTTGLYTFSVGADGSPTSPITRDLPPEILGSHLTRRDAKKLEDATLRGVGAMPWLSSRLFDVAADGSATLVAEQLEIKESSMTTSSGRTVNRTAFYYRDLLVTRIGSDGQVAWMRRIPRRMEGRAIADLTSFAWTKGLGCHYVVFYDNPENEGLLASERPESTSTVRGPLAAFRLDDATGAVTRIALFDSRDLNGVELLELSLARLEDLGTGTFMVEARVGDKQDVLLAVSPAVAAGPATTAVETTAAARLAYPRWALGFSPGIEYNSSVWPGTPREPTGCPTAEGEAAPALSALRRSIAGPTT